MKDSLEKQQRYYDLGETYFWFSAHYDIVMDFAQPLLQKKAQLDKLQILDVGCGPGNLISRLLPWGEVVGADASEDALAFCQQKHNIKTWQISGNTLPFDDNSFDFIFAIEVIEHIEDDHTAVKELYRILKPGGYLITTVPAFMFLWGSHDELYGHFRRYTRKRFCNLLRTAGFRVQKSRYFKLLFFFPLLVLRYLKRRTQTQTDDFYQVKPGVNDLFRKLINAETPIVSALNPPLGTSIISVSYKP